MRQIGVLLLVLVSCLAPAMACMRADAGMSAAERACCRAMEGRCGQMEMPASHGCCQKMPRSVHDHALKADAAVVYPVAVTAVSATPFALVVPGNGDGWAGGLELRPPESPPGTFAVLRI